MPDDATRFEQIAADDPITLAAHAISDQAFELSGQLGLSRWQLCVAMANACGHILADAADAVPKLPPNVVMPARGKALPREDALRRMDDLRQVMEGAYDLRNVKGSG